MERLFDVRVLLVLVIISLIFPLKLFFSHYCIGISKQESPEMVAGNAKKGDDQSFPKDFSGVIANRRAEAIKQAKKQGKDEYTYSLKVPPPPISGGN